MRHGRLGIMVAVWLASAGSVIAQTTPAPQPAPQPEPAPAVQPDPALPSLDDLLGLEEETGEVDRSELERQLTAQQAGEQFQQAVGLMGDAAGRLAGAGDTGVQTQRIQEDILRRLDQVIEAAQQNQSGGGGKSRSQSQSQQNQQQQPNQSSQAQPGGPPGNQGDQEHTGPGLSGVQLNPGVAPDGVTWGNLPDRVRESVAQGVTDRYSAMYRRMTELYYRKLAEQEGEP